MKKRGYQHGKHTLKSDNKVAKVTLAIISIICLVIISTIVLYPKNSTEAKTPEEFINKEPEIVVLEEKPEIVELEEPEPEEQLETVSTQDMPEKIGGYNVIGKIVIDKIGVNNNILDVTDDKSIDLAITKFWGPNINDIGNVSIIGHNYKNLFIDLKDLNVGDTFYLINKETGTKVNYKIYDIYTVKPSNVDCIEQNDDGKREATLITCNNGGKTRLILKAKEI